MYCVLVTFRSVSLILLTSLLYRVCCRLNQNRKYDCRPIKKCFQLKSQCKLSFFLLLAAVLMNPASSTITFSCISSRAGAPCFRDNVSSTATNGLPSTKLVLSLRGGGVKNKVNAATQKKQPKSEKTTAVKITTTKNAQKTPLSVIDWGIFGIYFCTACTITLPVLIVPMMDVELQAQASMTRAGAATSVGISLAAMVASMSPLGGGFGKIVNGFVCQQIGAPLSSKLYFTGSTLASLALASISLGTTAAGTTPASSMLLKLLTKESLGWIVAAIDFFAAIQWTVSSLFLSQYYRDSPALFARGVTVLSLASTSGQIASKVIGALLLQYIHWRRLAQIMVGLAMLGFGISTWTSHNMKVYTATASALVKSKDKLVANPTGTGQPRASVRHAITTVLGSGTFWLVGLAHVSGYLTRTSDRVIGSFLQDITSLSRKYSGATLFLF